MKRTSGPGTSSPSGLAIAPARRSWTYSRSLAFVASFETFGRLARRSACHCAVVARYTTALLRLDRVAAQLARDRRRRPTEPASDLAHPDPLAVQDRDLFPLGKRQIPLRHRSQRDWRP